MRGKSKKPTTLRRRKRRRKTAKVTNHNNYKKKKKNWGKLQRQREKKKTHKKGQTTKVYNRNLKDSACPSGTHAACQLGDEPFSLTSWKGSFSSPGQSQNLYPSDQNCQWDISVSLGSRVRLTFQSFDLEDGYYKNSPPDPAEKMLCNDVVKVS